VEEEAVAVGDDDSDDGEFGAGLLEDPPADSDAHFSESASEEADCADEDDAPAKSPTPTLTAEGARPPARMSVDEAEANKQAKQQRAERKRRRHADASCIHPSLADLEAREAEESQRRKMKMLEFWRNERVVYGRRQSAKFEAIVDVHTEPPEQNIPKRRPVKKVEAGSVSSAKPAAKPKAASKLKASAAATAGGEPAAKKLSGYLVFANEQRQAVCDAEPGISFVEVGRRLGALWKELDDAERAAYARRGAQGETGSSKPSEPAAPKPRAALSERPIPPPSALNKPAAIAVSQPAAKPAAKTVAKTYRDDEEEEEVLPAASKRMSMRS